MSETPTVIVETDGPVATLTLNRPDHLNSITQGMRASLEAALANFDDGGDIRVIRLRGAGRSFCAGYDLAGYGAGDDGRVRGGTEAIDGAATSGPHELASIESEVAIDTKVLRRNADWLMRLRRFRKPIIAQVQGHCLSGGLDILGICDMVLAGKSAKFGHPAARGLGIPITLGQLPHRIGPMRTKELLFTGDLFGAEEVHDWGMINRVIDDADLDRATMEYCQRVAMMPLDMLTVHKRVTDRWFELMGLREAVDAGVELDAIAHTNAVHYEFLRRVAENSLGDALAWRDGRYRQS